jgi:phage terminase small subunit
MTLVYFQLRKGLNDMPALKDARKEAFALAVARGSTLSNAYALIWRSEAKKSSLGVVSSKLAAVPAVRDRIAEIQAQLVVKTDITAQRVLEELAKIGFASYGDFLTIDENGKTNVDVSKLTKDQLAAISEMQIDTSEDGKQRIKVKLHDKRAALMDIGKHLGMFREKIEVSGPDGGAIQVKKRIDVNLLDQDERNQLKDILLSMAERRREAEMKTIEHDD